MQSIFCLVLICLAAPLYAGIVYDVNGATGHDWLHTKGALIKDSSGNVVILRGVNMFIRLQNERAKFMSARAAGANVVRLMLWKCDIETPGSNDTGNDKLGNDLRGLAAIDDAIGWAHDAGLMVILEQHIWSDAVAPAPNSFLSLPTLQAQWLAMWRLVVNRYKNDPTVIGIDLMNEPNCIPGVSIDQREAWETIAKNAVFDLKSYNPNLLFFVEGWWSVPGWEDTEFLKSPNIVYSEHIFYEGAPLPLPEWEQPWRIAYSLGDLTNGHDLLSQYMDSRFTVFTNQGIPVWIGEVGFLTRLPYWQHQMEDELALLDQRGIGYAAFVYGTSRWGLEYDIVDASYNLTTVGRVYRNHFTTPMATPDHR
jgi:hypothetical protein